MTQVKRTNIKVSYDESSEVKRYMEEQNYNQSKWIRKATERQMNIELFTSNRRQRKQQVI